MGYTLIWCEGLALALLGVALATAWTARGRSARTLWVALVFLVLFGAAAVLVLGSYRAFTEYARWVRTPWFFYTLSWLGTFTLAGLFLLWQGLKRPDAGLGRSAALWPRKGLWLGFGAAALALVVTVWNMDLAARVELALARQEAGALLLSMTPPPVAEEDNAARLMPAPSRNRACRSRSACMTRHGAASMPRKRWIGRTLLSLS